MKIVRVTYTVSESYSARNQQNIHQVMSDLRRMDTSGMLYHVCLSPNGKTFTHTAFFQNEQGEKLLLNLPSFKSFQEQLKASKPEIPPSQELLSLVGSSKDLF